MNAATQLIEQLFVKAMVMKATASVIKRYSTAKHSRGGVIAHRKWKKHRASGRR